MLQGRRIAAIGFAFLVMGAAQAQTPPCRPILVAPLDIQRQPDGALAVMLDVNGKPEKMDLSLTAMFSSVHASYARRQNLEAVALPNKMSAWTGHGFATETVKLDSIAFGPGAVTAKTKVYVVPDETGDDSAGVIGMHLLGNFGVEFDFAANKVKLFAGCTAVGGYWAEKYAELPLDLQTQGIPLATMLVDGKPVPVSFAVDQAGSAMPFNTARDVFKLKLDSDGVARVENSDPPLYQYRFRQIAADGIAIGNPLVELSGAPGGAHCNKPLPQSNGRTQLTPGITYFCYVSNEMALGMRELSQLHLFFDFPNRKLYFTAADAR